MTERLFKPEELEEMADRQEQAEREAVRQRNLAYFDPAKMVLRLNDRHDIRGAVVDLKRQGYEIGLEAFPDGNVLFRWVIHLTEKNWFTGQMLADFWHEFRRACVSAGNNPHTPDKWTWAINRSNAAAE